MSFYQAMQLGAVSLKPMIKECSDKTLKRKYITALIVKDILCLLLCMIIVTSFSIVFGEENSIVGVVTVLALLTFRFSNLDFNIGQSALTIFSIFGICMVGPFFASLSSTIVCFIINFICILVIVILSCHNMILSNQSTFVLSYLLLYGYEVSSIEGYLSRIIGLAIGGTIVCLVFYFKQRKLKLENTILDIVKDVNLENEHTKWQLKLTLGVCSAMLIGQYLNLPRTMWIGFSCLSILQPYKDKLEFRYEKRVLFVIIGCLLFAAIYIILPESYYGYIGIIGGLMVGLSATYQWQTVFNCFGALTTAVPVFGLGGAIILRILNNAFGAIYSKLYDKYFEVIYNKILGRNSIDKLMEG